MPMVRCLGCCGPLSPRMLSPSSSTPAPTDGKLARLREMETRGGYDSVIRPGRLHLRRLPTRVRPSLRARNMLEEADQLYMSYQTAQAA